MKILGMSNETPYSKRYIVNISENEIKKILGNLYDKKTEIGVGKIINVSDIYNRYKSMTENKKRLNEIKSLAKDIERSVSKLTDVIVSDE